MTAPALPVQSTLVSGETIMSAILMQTGVLFAPKDESYHLTTEEFIAGDFTAAYSDFLKLYDLETYDPEDNDCDKFALYARATLEAAKALRQRPQVFEISASAVDHHDSGLAGTPLTELNHMQTPAGHIDEYARGRMLSLDLRHTERRHQRCARGGEVQNNDDG